MRYLVTARVKPGREAALAAAIETRTLGAGSVAGGEYLHNMETARLMRDGSVKWVEVCYCATPIEEVWTYCEEYCEVGLVKDADSVSLWKNVNFAETWACCDCDCMEKLFCSI